MEGQYKPTLQLFCYPFQQFQNFFIYQNEHWLGFNAIVGIFINNSRSKKHMKFIVKIIR